MNPLRQRSKSLKWNVPVTTGSHHVNLLLFFNDFCKSQRAPSHLQKLTNRLGPIISGMSESGQQCSSFDIFTRSNRQLIQKNYHIFLIKKLFCIPVLLYFLNIPVPSHVAASTTLFLLWLQ